MQHRRTIALGTLGFAGAAMFPASLAAASGPPATTPGGDYCAAHLALEASVANDDPEDDQSAFEAAQAAAPEEIADALTTVLELGAAETDGPPPPEFFEAYGGVIDWVRENCGFAELEVLAQDYSFAGIGGEIPAGPTVVDLVNEGTEYHEIVFMRRSDDATMPLEELMALPEEEFGSMVTSVGSGFAAPGTTGSTVVDLTPGEYIGICFIPVGATEEALAEMLAAGSVPADSVGGPGTVAVDMATEATMSAHDTTVTTVASDGSTSPAGSMAPGELGPPHFTEGMFVEFTVVDGATAGTDTTTGTDAASNTTSGDTVAPTTTG